MKFACRPAIAFLLLVLASAAAPASLFGRHPKSAAELEAKIAREKNPVKRAKLEVQLGGVQLQQAIHDYDQHQPKQGAALLSGFTRSMENSWNTLESTGRDAAKKPQGFMELEIALRENRRELRDLRERIPYYSRAPVDRAIQRLGSLHAKVLLALFPGAAQPSGTQAINSKAQAARRSRSVAHP